MHATKISLSEDELVLMKNSAWILTKNALLDKMNEGLGNLANRMQYYFDAKSALLPEEIRTCSAKISRGEKYQGLPYLILDYPRLFGKDQILAIRTMFWWGNYCSCTLHVRGKFIEPVLKRIKASTENVSNLYVATDGDEWNHDLHKGNYYVWNTAALPKEPGSGEMTFLKISCLTELAQWYEMEEGLFTSFRYLLGLLEGLTTDAVEEVF